VPVLTERTPRVVAARKLLRRAARDRAGRFLAEGAQAVSAAVEARRGAAAPDRAGRILELFLTEAAAARRRELADRAVAAGVPVSLVTERAAAALSETVTPQGLVAVCAAVTVPLDRVWTAGSARLVVVLVEPADPGNVGTVIRLADAAGADAVVLAGAAVDPHNGKCVRSSAGSVFHLPLVAEREVDRVLTACRAAGLTLLAADGGGERELFEPGLEATLAGRCGWLFGTEAHGLPEAVAAAADHRVRVPIYGRAESLNLAGAAAVCVYATARAGRAARIDPPTVPST
jgi:TrmH family RNA methyltransferase